MDAETWITIALVCVVAFILGGMYVIGYRDGQQAHRYHNLEGD